MLSIAPIAPRALARWVVAAALIGAGTTGCKGLVDKVLGRDDAGPGAAEVAAPEGPNPDDALRLKLDEYVKCLNALTASARASEKRYLSTLPRKGPTGHESWADVYALPEGAASGCSESVKKAKAMPPKNAKLEAAGDEFAKAAATLDALVDEADTYFDEKKFKDDDWAKGKELHPKLMAAWANFDKADKALHAELDALSKPLAERTLARIERAEGKRFRWNRKHVLNVARDVVEASDPPGKDAAVDVARFEQTYDALEAALNDLTAYGSAHEGELLGDAHPSTPNADENYAKFVSAADTFKKAAKDLRRCLKDAPASAKADAGGVDVDRIPSCAEGRPGEVADRVIKTYNAFIRVSNDNPFP